MDVAEIAQQLAQAEIHVAAGERLIAGQRDTIAEFEKAHADPAEAKAVLASLEETQRLHVENRDRLKRELERAARNHG